MRVGARRPAPHLTPGPFPLDGARERYRRVHRPDGPEEQASRVHRGPRQDGPGGGRGTGQRPLVHLPPDPAHRPALPLPPCPADAEPRLDRGAGDPPALRVRRRPARGPRAVESDTIERSTTGDGNGAAPHRQPGHRRERTVLVRPRRVRQARRQFRRLGLHRQAGPDHLRAQARTAGRRAPARTARVLADHAPASVRDPQERGPGHRAQARSGGSAAVLPAVLHGGCDGSGRYGNGCGRSRGDGTGLPGRNGRPDRGRPGRASGRAADGRPRGGRRPRRPAGRRRPRPGQLHAQALHGGGGVRAPLPVPGPGPGLRCSSARAAVRRSSLPRPRARVGPSPCLPGSGLAADPVRPGAAAAARRGRALGASRCGAGPGLPDRRVAQQLHLGAQVGDPRHDAARLHRSSAGPPSPDGQPGPDPARTRTRADRPGLPRGRPPGPHPAGCERAAAHAPGRPVARPDSRRHRPARDHRGPGAAGAGAAAATAGAFRAEPHPGARRRTRPTARVHRTAHRHAAGAAAADPQRGVPGGRDGTARAHPRARRCRQEHPAREVPPGEPPRLPHRIPLRLHRLRTAHAVGPRTGDADRGDGPAARHPVPAATRRLRRTGPRMRGGGGRAPHRGGHGGRALRTLHHPGHDGTALHVGAARGGRRPRGSPGGTARDPRRRRRGRARGGAAALGTGDRLLRGGPVQRLPRAGPHVGRLVGAPEGPSTAADRRGRAAAREASGPGGAAAGHRAARPRPRVRGGPAGVLRRRGRAAGREARRARGRAPAEPEAGRAGGRAGGRKRQERRRGRRRHRRRRGTVPERADREPAEAPPALLPHGRPDAHPGDPVRAPPGPHPRPGGPRAGPGGTGAAGHHSPADQRGPRRAVRARGGIRRGGRAPLRAAVPARSGGVRRSGDRVPPVRPAGDHATAGRPGPYGPDARGGVAGDRVLRGPGRSRGAGGGDLPPAAG
ncbi:hypothetical protein SAVIM40S_03041 [Streptomyces avidinii]